jgi:sporulation protein YlmC with PRC-barrel domain
MAMTRRLTTAPVVLAAALFLTGSTGYAQYTYVKAKDSSASQSSTQTNAGQSKQTAQQQVSGQIQRSKDVQVKTLDPQGQAKKNRVVLMQTDQGRQVVVDLGPSQALQGISLKQGTQIDASGRWVRISDRPVLWANQATIDGKKVQIKRQQGGQSRQLTGRVMRTKQVDIRGTDFTNQVVLLQTEQGRQIVADLGPMTNLRGFRLKPGAEIEVRGQPARIGDQLVLMADQVSAGGKTVSVRRPDQPSAQLQRGSQQRAAQQQVSKGSFHQQTPSRFNVIPASSLIGRPVQDNQGNHVGEATHLMINANTGDIRYLLVSSGKGSQHSGQGSQRESQGSQGGQDLIPVPWSAVRYQGKTFQVNASSKTLEQVPHVSLSDLNQLTQPRLVTQVQNYYLVPEEPQQGPGGRQQSQGQQGQAQQGMQDQRGGMRQQSRGDGQAADQESTGSSSSGSQQQARQSAQRRGQGNEPHILIGRGIVTTLFPPMYASATEVRGTEVESADGQFVGEIDRVMIDPDHGYVAYVLIAEGGTLGGSEAWIPVPFKALEWSPQGHYTLSVDQQQLTQVQALPKREMPAQVRAQQLERLYERFGVSPYWEQG